MRTSPKRGAYVTVTLFINEKSKYQIRHFSLIKILFYVLAADKAKLGLLMTGFAKSCHVNVDGLL